MDIQTSKKLGIFGVSLIFLDFVLGFILRLSRNLSIGWNISTYDIIRIIGIIFILISLHNLANIYQTKTISFNAKKGAIIVIIYYIIQKIPISQIITNAAVTNTVIGLALRIIQLLFIIVLLLVFIIAAAYVRRSLNELANSSGINGFATAGKWLFVGAILTIFLVGFIIMGIAFLILAIAFSDLKNAQPIPQGTMDISPLAQTILTLNYEIKAYCPYCGSPLPPEAHFCTQCGKQI